jgi:hypothetical protein
VPGCRDLMTYVRRSLDRGATSTFRPLVSIVGKARRPRSAAAFSLLTFDLHLCPQTPPIPPACDRGAPGRLQLYVDNTLAGETDVPYATPIAFNPGALTCGANPGSPVTDNYPGPFRFTGTLHSVTVDVSGELITDPEAEMRLHLARQ